MTIEELIENEWYVVRYSGETPEIALSSAFYYLTRAQDGPQLVLASEQRKKLQEAAIARFFEIITRDLNHENVGKAIYRGVARSIVNYQRYLNFCVRQQLENQLREQVTASFREFLCKELELLKRGKSSNINCGLDELVDFSRQLELDANECLVQLQELLSRNPALSSVAE